MSPLFTEWLGTWRVDCSCQWQTLLLLISTYHSMILPRDIGFEYSFAAAATCRADFLLLPTVFALNGVGRIMVYIMVQEQLWLRTQAQISSCYYSQSNCPGLAG